MIAFTSSDQRLISGPRSHAIVRWMLIRLVVYLMGATIPVTLLVIFSAAYSYIAPSQLRDSRPTPKLEQRLPEKGAPILQEEKPEQRPPNKSPPDFQERPVLQDSAANGHRGTNQGGGPDIADAHASVPRSQPNPKLEQPPLPRERPLPKKRPPATHPTGELAALPPASQQYRVVEPYAVGGRTYVPAYGPKYRAVGTALVYAVGADGRYTANGEPYKDSGISAAHPTMPLPSYVRVTNLRNGKSMIVRVNDRGPYNPSGIIELSPKAAELLGISGKGGDSAVRIEYVGPAPIEGEPVGRLIATLRVGEPAPPPKGAPVADAPPGSLPAPPRPVPQSRGK